MKLPRFRLAVLLFVFGSSHASTLAESSPLQSFAARFTTGPSWDTAQPPSTQAGFAGHSANLKRLRDDGLIQFGARFGETGLVVVLAPDLDAARALFAEDPSLAAKTFVLQIDPFSAFYPGSTTYLQTPEATVMRDYLAAYNRHDADAVAAHLAENLIWYSIAGDTLSPEANSRVAIREWLVGHFEAHPTTRSDYLAFEQTGPYITVRERASSINAEGKRVGQQAFAVHEIRNHLIQRVWYFPAH